MLRDRSFVVLLCLCGAWIPHGLAAIPAVDRPEEEPSLVIEHFGSERGLSVSNVTAVHQDRAGFVWIGTRAGLILYDGHSQTTFEHDVGDPGSIADNYVRTVYEDREGNLWIGTNSSGLERLDRASWTFEHYRHDSADETTISHDSVNVILQDREGTLWVGTQIGLNRFDPKSGRFERILADPEDPRSLSNDYVYALCDGIDGGLWVGTVGGGLNRMDRERGSFNAYRHDPEDPNALLSDEIFALVEDAQGQLWIGTEDGLSRLDRGRTVFENYVADGQDRGGLSYPLVTSLVVDQEQVLWVGSWGGGVDRIDTRSGTFLRSAADSAPGLAAERIAALAVDGSGSVWFGTWSQGVIRSRRPAVRASLMTTRDGLSFDDVTAVLEDGRGRLWAGTWGGGLNVRLPGTRRFDAGFRERLEVLVEGTVLSLEEAGAGDVWAGTMGPLFRVGLGGEESSDGHSPAGTGALGPGYVTAVHRDSDGALWVGVGGSGLYRRRPEGGFEAHVHDPANPSSLSDNYVTSIVEDDSGVLWVGTRSGGINALDRESGHVQRYEPEPGNPDSLSYHYVTSAAVDDRGTVWIGTAGGGLNAIRQDGDGVRFERFTESDGLIDDTIRSLAADGRLLWLATPHGVTRFDTRDGSFVSFDASDGLPGSGFNQSAAWTGRDHVYFGAASGLLAIPRGHAVTTPVAAPTLLRAVRTIDEPPVMDGAPWDLERLEVPYGEILSFAFAVLDYGDPRRHRFAYRLIGLRENWIDIGDRREVTFTDLDPGEYTLEIRGRTSHGVWSEASPSLRLVVVPPFWMTAWFRLLLLAGLILAVFAAHRRRTTALKRRNRELEALKDQREAALAEMHASREELGETYDRLRRLTRRLELAKEDERKRIARELHDEMGQCLTAAKINLQLLATVPGSSEAAGRATDTIDLVDRMIRHVRTLSLDLRPPLLDELGLEPALRSYLEAQAQRTGLAIEMPGNNGISEDLPAEIGITAFRFVQEALTNVIRHAGATRVDVRLVDDGDHLDVAVRDDGCGFDVEEVLRQAAGGQHLGLLGIRERVELLGGQLEIASTPDEGTVLAVQIPWR